MPPEVSRESDALENIARSTIVMTLLVRDEADIVRENLEFHLSQGIDHVIATDNGSVDGTREILSEYARAGVLTLIDEPGRDYSQHRWVTRMALMARDQIGADWIINNDADEFWYAPDGDLKQSLAREVADIQFCRRYNMVFAFDRDEDVPWCKKAVFRVVKPVPIPASENHLIDPLPCPYFYLALPGKALLKAMGLRSVHQGNHNADYDRQPDTHRSDILIYHFPVRSRTQFETKIRQGGAAYAANTELPTSMGWHWRRWYRMLNDHGLEKAIADALPDSDRLERDVSDGSVVIDVRMQSETNN